MSQTRSLEYQTPDSTFEVNQRFVSVQEAGLYGGFDFVPTANLNLTFNHLTTGILYTSQALSTSRLGVIITKQGTQIRQDAVTPLAINPTTAITRRDAVICTHRYLLITGGQAATYAVLENIGSGEPTLAQNQMLLGILELPISCTALNQVGVTYTPKRVLSLSALKTLVDGKEDIDATILRRGNVINNFTSTDVDLPASANTVKVLNESKLNISQGAWTTQTSILTGWGAASASVLPTARLRKDQREKVYFTGYIEYVGGGGANDLFNIASGFMPNSVKMLPALILNGANLIPCGVIIQADGLVRVVTSHTFASGDFICFDGCSYFKNI